MTSGVLSSSKKHKKSHLTEAARIFGNLRRKLDLIKLLAGSVMEGRSEGTADGAPQPNSTLLPSVHTTILDDFVLGMATQQIIKHTSFLG